MIIAADTFRFNIPSQPKVQSQIMKLCLTCQMRISWDTQTCMHLYHPTLKILYEVFLARIDV